MVLTIAMISEDFDPARAGVGVHLQNLVRALVARGHRAVVITSRRRGEPKRSDAAGVTIYRNASVRISGFSHSVTTTRAIRSILERHRVDVVHEHFLSRMAVQAQRAARQAAIPSIYTYHMAEEILTSPFAWCPPLQRRLTRAIVGFCNRFDMVTFPSAALCQAVTAKGLTTSAFVLGNAIGFKSQPVPLRPAAPDRFVVLFAGRLSPEKNLVLLLRAFARFRERHTFANLWLAGDGPQRKELEKLSRHLGVTSGVRFLGHLPNAELAECYRAADVFVLPSLFETQGMVCVEAMQFGKPLVVSDGIVSRHELVDAGQNGYLFDHTSEEELARVLDRLASDPAVRAAMAARSLEKAKEFSLDAVVAAHERLYRDLVGAHL